MDFKQLEIDGEAYQPKDEEARKEMVGATTSAAGKAGRVPAPPAGAANRCLYSDGTWKVPPDTNTTYGPATQSAAGLMGAADKKKLDGISVVNNTADANKRVAYASSAGSASTATSAAKATNDANGNNIVNTYLPLTGGTVSGNIKASSFLLGDQQRLKWEGSEQAISIYGMKMRDGGANQLRVDVNPADYTYMLAAGCIGSYYALQSYGYGIYDLGGPGYPWKTVYANTGQISTSDKRKKENIKEFDSGFIKDFIMGITPVSYRLIDNDSGRTHYGIIAQDIEGLMGRLGMGSKDFAGFIKSPKTVTELRETEYKGEDGKTKKRMEPYIQAVEGEYEYALRYEEFIGPLIKMVQLQQEEIERLGCRVSELENAGKAP